jgi:hypothetical protein
MPGRTWQPRPVNVGPGEGEGNGWGGGRYGLGGALPRAGFPCAMRRIAHGARPAGEDDPPRTPAGGHMNVVAPARRIAPAAADAYH